MKAKEIYEKIEELVFQKYRTKTAFCEATSRGRENFMIKVNRVTNGHRDSQVNKTESILNDLGYELCIRPIEKEEEQFLNLGERGGGGDKNNKEIETIFEKRKCFK